MPKSYVDFKALKERVSIIDIVTTSFNGQPFPAAFTVE